MRRPSRRKKCSVACGEWGVSKDVVMRALKHLRSCFSEKSKRPALTKANCMVGRQDMIMMDDQVRLYTRQLPSVMRELRKAVLRHDWSEAATLLLLLCCPGMRDHSTVILRTCFLLLCCHPKSNLSLMSEFIRDCTEYESETDVIKFIRILFALREVPPRTLKRGCHIRKGVGYRIVDDIMFKNI